MISRHQENRSRIKHWEVSPTVKGVYNKVKENKMIKVNNSFKAENPSAKIEAGVPVELQSLESFEKANLRDIEPIVIANVSEVLEYKTFIKRYDYRWREKNIEDIIARKIIKKERFSLFEIIYLFFELRLMHKDILIKNDKTIPDDKYKTAAYASLLRNFPIFMKRIIIWDRLISTIFLFDINNLQARIARDLLLSLLEKEDIYLNGILKDEPVSKEITSDLNFLIHKLSKNMPNYLKGLNIIDSTLRFIIPNTNYDKIESLMFEICRLRPNSFNDTLDLDYFKYFLHVFRTTGTFDSLLYLDIYQKKQLTNYYGEILFLLKLISMSMYTVNKTLLLSVSQLDFMPNSKIINQSLATFMNTKHISKTTFDLIIKALTNQSFILVSFFYKYASADCNKYLYPFIKQTIDNKAHLTNINEQIKFVPDIEEIAYKEDK
jgi:hypothetical protein